MNKTTQTSNTPNSKLIDNIPQWSEARNSEEEATGIRKCRRKSNVEIIN